MRGLEYAGRLGKVAIGRGGGSGGVSAGAGEAQVVVCVAGIE